jgi:hypothetical protein
LQKFEFLSLEQGQSKKFQADHDVAPRPCAQATLASGARP